MADSPASSPPRADRAFESPASRIGRRDSAASGGLPASVTRAGKALAGAIRKFVRDVTRKLDRETVAAIYLKGSGLEIGALHNPLRVPPVARVRYVDRLSTPDLRRQYPELATLELVEVDIVDDGEHLRTVGDGTQDFVIANQVLEHCQNPLFTLAQWLRVLKDGGILFASLPDKRFSFDSDRPVTAIAHIVRDFHEGPAWSKRGHFEEWVRLVEHIDPADAEARVEELLRIDYSIHFHVWTQAEMLELLTTARGLLGGFDIELFLKTDYEVEHLIVLRKTGPLSSAAAV